MIQMHCGMCELTWITYNDNPRTCPNCKSEEIETREQAATHHNLEYDWSHDMFDEEE